MHQKQNGIQNMWKRKLKGNQYRTQWKIFACEIIIIIICSNETILVVWILNALEIESHRMQWHRNVRYALTSCITTQCNIILMLYFLKQNSICKLCILCNANGFWIPFDSWSNRFGCVIFRQPILITVWNSVRTEISRQTLAENTECTDNVNSNFPLRGTKHSKKKKIK